MISFAAVIRVFISDLARSGLQLIQRLWVGGDAVGGHLVRCVPYCKRAGEQPAGHRQIPLLRHQHADDLPELIE